MPIPALSIIASADDATAELVVHGVVAGDAPEAPGFDPELLSALGVTGKREQIVRAVVEGRRVAFAEGSVRDAAGKVVATATSTLLVFSTVDAT